MSRLEMNVFAKTEEEMYTRPAQAKAARSIDSVITELNQVRSEEAAHLRSQFYTAFNQIVELLTDDRAVRIASLEEKRDDLIVVARKAGHEAFIMDKQTIINSLQEHAKLKAVATSAANKVEQLQYEAKQSNPRLMTRFEKLERDKALSEAQEKAESTAMAESLFSEEHNRLLPKLRELKAKHSEAVNAVTVVSEEIERLQRLQ
jgi:hypothetical protein